MGIACFADWKKDKAGHGRNVTAEAPSAVEVENGKGNESKEFDTSIAETINLVLYGTFTFLESALCITPGSTNAFTCPNGFNDADFESDDFPPGEGEVGSNAEEERAGTGTEWAMRTSVREVSRELFPVVLDVAETAFHPSLSSESQVSEEGGNLSIGEAVEVVEEVASVEDEVSVEAVEEEEKEGRVVVDDLEVAEKR
ncbi:hypothetical protein GG344DRAFT_70222 [Lentinula edodes]|nr:hypothetical protein GG344DRAFT_70222 [Lentinula edodes]